LQKAFSTLFPNRKDVSFCVPLGKAEDEAAPKELRNRFGILGDLERDMIQALNTEEDDEAAPDSTPPASERQAPTLSDMPTLEDDPLVILIRIHLLLRVSVT
jgi:hypothetical protein